MVSDFTDFGLEKPADGEKENTWGAVINLNMGLIEDMLRGIATKIVTGGSYTLTKNDGASDEARCAALRFTGALTANQEIVIPSLSKHYIVLNETTGNFTLTIKTAVALSETVVIPQGGCVFIFCDGSDVRPVSIAALSATLNGNANLIENFAVNQVFGTYNNAGNKSAGVTLDFEDGDYQVITLTGNVTSLTINNFTNALDATRPATLRLLIVQDGTGGRTFEPGAGFISPNGSITLSSSPNAIDQMEITNWPSLGFKTVNLATNYSA